LVDGPKMVRNIQKMAHVARENGVALRPHVKTHKIPGIAKVQLEAGASGITVAKLSEAEVMADGGIEDIFVAYPLVTEAKIRRAVRLAERVRLVVGVDSLEGARRLSAAAEGHILEKLTEEHGMLSVDEDCDLEVGDTLEIIPNHICSTVNLHDEIYLVGEDGVVEETRVAARGMVR